MSRYLVIPFLWIITAACSYGQSFQSITSKVLERSETRDQSKQYFLDVSYDQSEYEDWIDAYSPNLFAAPLDLEYSSQLTQSPYHEVWISISGVSQFLVSIGTRAINPGTLIQGFDNTRSRLFEWSFSDLQAGKALTPVIKGDKLLLKIFSGESENSSRLDINTIYISEDQSYGAGRDFGFGTSMDCEINIACPTGDNFRTQQRSAVRIMMVLEEGIGWCSGALINNTSNDGTPFILSAFHCLGDFTPMFDQWRFDFNYAFDQCISTSEEPGFQSMTGCVLRARKRDSDFMLLELNGEIPVFYQPYYSGWNWQEGYLPAKTTLIHHPSGDVKKVSLEKQEAKIHPNSIDWNEGYTTPANYHFRVRFDEGIYEPGSSGAPLFDGAGRVVAQLHGGAADCMSNYAYCGMLSRSWSKNDEPFESLGYWLDPGDTGKEVIDGIEHSDAGNTFLLAGKVLNPKGQALSNLEIRIGGDLEIAVMTDTTGSYKIEILPKSGRLTIEPYKNINPENGVSALDLLLIQKHLLGTKPFEEEYQIIAADANGNGTASAADILLLQKLLLNKISSLITNNSWVFTPDLEQIDPPAGDSLTIDFMAIKVGDVNGSADPNQ